MPGEEPGLRPGAACKALSPLGSGPARAESMSAVLHQAPAPSLGELRQHFRDGKLALLEHFRLARPTAPAATRLVRGLTEARRPHADRTLGARPHAA